MRASTAPNEAARLEVLRQFNVLDTEAEESFDDITRLAAYICQTPIAVISLVDSDRQWFKSRIGLSVSETAEIFPFALMQSSSPGHLSFVTPSPTTGSRKTLWSSLTQTSDSMPARRSLPSKDSGLARFA